MRSNSAHHPCNSMPLLLCLVLQALSVIHQSAALQEDSHSQAVASAVLSSLVPAWLAAGRGSDELWGSLLAALPGLPATRRLRLLESLMKALPQVRQQDGEQTGQVWISRLVPLLWEGCACAGCVSVGVGACAVYSQACSVCSCLLVLGGA